MAKKTVIGIRSVYTAGDERLERKVIVPCAYADKTGTIRLKDVKLTEAEKRTIEALAMRLFIEHKKVIHKTTQPDGAKELSAFLLVGKSMED